MLVEPCAPCRTVKVVEPEFMLKSTTLTGSWTEWERVPDAAVTVTEKVVGRVEVTVKVAVAEPPCVIVTLEELREGVRPGADTEYDRVTVPEKPLMPEMVRVEFPLAPESNMIDDGLEAILKSTTFTVMVVEWESAPLVPVTVTTYWPAGEAPVTDIVSVEKTLPPDVTVTLLGFVVKASPPGAEDAVKATWPENKFTLVKVIVTVPGEPDSATRLEAEEEMPKSTTLTVRVAVSNVEPPTSEPVTVTR
jgi:hypothetical protein